MSDPKEIPFRYQIQLEGKLDPNWSEWLEGFEISWLENGDSLLVGSVPDQTALYGLLTKIRDMNLKLIHVSQL